MWVWGAGLVVVLLVLIGGLLWAVMATTAHRSAAPTAADAVGPASARQILDRRYARGELGTEEYRERMQTLGG